MPNLFQNPSFSPSVGHTSLFVGFILRCPSHLMGKIAGLFLDDLTWSLQLVIPKRQGLSLLRVGAEVLEGQLISLTWVGLYPGVKQGVRGGGGGSLLSHTWGGLSTHPCDGGIRKGQLYPDHTRPHQQRASGTRSGGTGRCARWRKILITRDHAPSHCSQLFHSLS